ncbi:lasso peptide biosynthesis B2 protein [Xanthomonas campestris pv. phormiicola]|nr:lasso peptide biosynthesis B2 protein [Xanthomonas campestris pv. phormiicola]UYC17398.1 lasso peptide biosynthesis B2 protein [Xanthomonas campestris pv. phormiicola]
MSERLYLDHNVFFREIDGTYLFLDSAKDKYLTLTGAQAEWFSEIRQSGNASTLSTNALKFSDRLTQSGLVRTQSEGGKPIEEIHYQTPEYSVFMRGADVPPSASVKDAPRFFMTYMASCLSHRHNKTDVSRTLQAVKHWKSGLPDARADLRKRAIELTERFHGLTPFFYTSYDACFFTSLFLVKYLSRFGLSADWVFAVRLVPFSAHCWVEFDHVVLNEDYDKTLAFKPIMLA